MKKLISILISLLVFPIYTIAYSDYIIPGGDTLGISVNSDGILITGFYKIKGKYNKSSLKVGDYIVEVNNSNVDSLDTLTKLIDQYKNDDEIKIKYRRNNKLYTGEAYSFSNSQNNYK